MAGRVRKPAKTRDVFSILVVEHCETLATGLRAYLEFRGHAVSLASDLASAQGKLRERRFDVLISDVHLPDGPCYSLLRSGCALPPLIVTMSGFDTAGEAASALPSVSRHLVKPFEPEELDRMLAEFAAEFASS